MSAMHLQELEVQSIEQASAKAKQDADLRRRQLEPRGRGRPRTEDVDAELAQLAKWRPDGTIDDSLFDTSPRDERECACGVWVWGIGMSGTSTSVCL